MDIAAYSPDGMEPWEWDRIATFVRQTTLTAQKHHAGKFRTKDMIGAVAAFTWWVTEVACYPMETSIVFDRVTIADYIETGCDALKPGSRATRRSILLRVAEAVLDPEERVERLSPVHKDNPAQPLLRVRATATAVLGGRADDAEPQARLPTHPRPGPRGGTVHRRYALPHDQSGHR